METILAFLRIYYESLNESMVLIVSAVGVIKTYILIDSYAKNNRYKQIKIELKLVEQVIKKIKELRSKEELQEEEVKKFLNQVEQLSYYINNGDIDFKIAQQMLSHVYETIKEDCEVFLKDPKTYKSTKKIINKLNNACIFNIVDFIKRYFAIIFVIIYIILNFISNY